MRSLFYGESAVQLYFLPQLVVMQILLISIHLAHRTKMILLTVLFLLLAGAFYYVGYKENCFGMTKPLALITYLLSALWFSKRIAGNKNSPNYWIAGSVLTVTSLVPQFISFPFSIEFMSLPIGVWVLLYWQ